MDHLTEELARARLTARLGEAKRLRRGRRLTRDRRLSRRAEEAARQASIELL